MQIIIDRSVNAIAVDEENQFSSTARDTNYGFRIHGTTIFNLDSINKTFYTIFSSPKAAHEDPRDPEQF